jgi:hypothetical protein
MKDRQKLKETIATIIVDNSETAFVDDIAEKILQEIEK